MTRPCRALILASVLILLVLPASAARRPFVTVRGHQLFLRGREYKFLGANYWYGSLLGLELERGRGRLTHELDFLRSHGITNLRLMAGSEGFGEMNGVQRVGPPLQPQPGKFDERVFKALDLLLFEMSKRRMKAVIFLSNNWEWSGGFQQYLIWNHVISDDLLTKKPDWDELRDVVSKFYTCPPCVSDYERQAAAIINRRNSYSGVQYFSDPTIMAWEIANEPRPMRPAANAAYNRWLADTSARIRSLDHHHLITAGLEGWIGTTDLELFRSVNEDKNIDYLTVHIWPKNWGWFKSGRMSEDLPSVLAQTDKYLTENLAVASTLDKPLVIEEFGLPRDGESLDPSATTKIRDIYYQHVLSYILSSDRIPGANFWAFGGTARPNKDQTYWKPGNDLMGDPPMEPQGLNSVFDNDRSTWDVISLAAEGLRDRAH